ncbi:MAG: hypothetical protein ACTSUG_13420 [Candidatus Helarchaeota archaeon]
MKKIIILTICVLFLNISTFSKSLNLTKKFKKLNVLLKNTNIDSFPITLNIRTKIHYMLNKDKEILLKFIFKNGKKEIQKFKLNYYNEFWYDKKKFINLRKVIFIGKKEDKNNLDSMDIRINTESRGIIYFLRFGFGKFKYKKENFFDFNNFVKVKDGYYKEKSIKDINNISQDIADKVKEIIKNKYGWLVNNDIKILFLESKFDKYLPANYLVIRDLSKVFDFDKGKFKGNIKNAYYQMIAHQFRCTLHEFIEMNLREYCNLLYPMDLLRFVGDGLTQYIVEDIFKELNEIMYITLITNKDRMIKKNYKCKKINLIANLKLLLMGGNYVYYPAMQYFWEKNIETRHINIKNLLTNYGKCNNKKGGKIFLNILQKEMKCSVNDLKNELRINISEMKEYYIKKYQKILIN